MYMWETETKWFTNSLFCALTKQQVLIIHTLLTLLLHLLDDWYSWAPCCSLVTLSNQLLPYTKNILMKYKFLDPCFSLVAWHLIKLAASVPCALKTFYWNINLHGWVIRCQIQKLTFMSDYFERHISHL